MSAFPKPDFLHPNGDFYWGADGLTKREYFAAKAMAAWIQALALRHGEPGWSDECACTEAARLAKFSADDLIRILEVKP